MKKPNFLIDFLFYKQEKIVVSKLNKQKAEDKKSIKKINPLVDFLFYKPAKKESLVLAEKEDKSMALPKDNDKRMFLKLAGLVGLGVTASAMIPKKAEALVFGSAPAASHVGVKDSSNSPINPATEGTLQSILEDTADLATIKTSTDKLNKLGFTGDTPAPTSFLMTAPVDANNSRISPASDDAIMYLRRIAKLLEPSATTDSSYRQRVAVEVMPSTTVSGTVTANVGTGTMAALTTVNQLAGVDARYLFMDTARNAYALGIRNNLTN